MNKNRFPEGWDEEKVRRVLAYYEEQSEEDVLLEDEAAVEPSETVMNVLTTSSPRSGNSSRSITVNAGRKFRA
jgi:hypothetical protein